MKTSVFKTANEACLMIAGAGFCLLAIVAWHPEIAHVPHKHHAVAKTQKTAPVQVAELERLPEQANSDDINMLFDKAAIRQHQPAVKQPTLHMAYNTFGALEKWEKKVGNK